MIMVYLECGHMASKTWVWTASSTAGESVSNSGSTQDGGGDLLSVHPAGSTQMSDEVINPTVAIENTDPYKRRAVQPRYYPPAIRLARKLFRVHIQRKLSPDEVAELSQEKARKAMESVLRQDATTTAAWLISCLDRLGICYIKRSSDGDIRKKRSVRFAAVDMEPDALHFHVDMKALPWGVSVEALKNKETVDNLAMSAGRAVTVHWTPESGIIYTVERGSGRMGIRQHVKLSDMWDTMPASADSLAIPFGETNNRRPIYISIGSMPHMLIAGTTGAGKTNFLHVVINTLVRRNKPDRLQLVLIDLKGGLAFKRYEGLPHLRKIHNICESGIIDDREKVFDLLAWLITEGERRMHLLGEANTEDIGQYNARRKHRLPYIIVVVDEWADMMYGVSKSEAETKLVNIVQRMRAVGIHVILATQVPKSEVITGLIKGNMPCRVGFSVPNLHASMAILDSRAAVQLGVVGRCVVQYKDEKTIQTPYISNELIQQTLQGAISGDYGTATASHDVSEREVREWAIEHNNGYLTLSTLFNQYKERGITRAEMAEWVEAWEGQEYQIGAAVYVVQPAAGSRGRRLVVITEDESNDAAID